MEYWTGLVRERNSIYRRALACYQLKEISIKVSYISGLLIKFKIRFLDVTLFSSNRTASQCRRVQ